MEPNAQITDIAHAIQLAVTPIFLLAGVGITVNILTTRLGRIVDRARVLAGQAQVRDRHEPPAWSTEMAVLSRRVRLIYRAIARQYYLCPERVSPRDHPLFRLLPGPQSLHPD